MSNISELLNNVAEANNGAITLAGNVIGSLADIGGAINLVVSAIDLFLNDDQEILNELNNIQAQIQNGFEAVAAEERAANILSRLNSLDPALAQAQSVIDNLKADLKQTPPVDEEYRLQQIGLCLDSVEQLNQDDKWLTNYADEIYYGSPWGPDPADQTDWWTGLIAPTANSDGTVFSCRYVLPDFLRVLFDFMLVASAFEANYAALYQTQFQTYSKRLQNVYNTSKQGLLTIRKPTSSQLGILSFNQTDHWYENYSVSAMFGPTEPPGPGQFPYIDSLNSTGGNAPGNATQWHSPFQPVTFVLDWDGNVAQGPLPGQCVPLQAAGYLDPEYGYNQEYGVVHTYTGYSNISNYPPIPLPSAKPDVFWPQFEASLNLALRRNYKQAYSDIGLATVWKTINVLNGLGGQPALGEYDTDVVWTLREIGNLLGSAFSRPSSGVSAQSVISGLTTIATNMDAGVSAVKPAPPVVRPLSLRNALNNAFAAVTFTCRPGGTVPPTVNLE